MFEELRDQVTSDIGFWRTSRPARFKSSFGGKARDYAGCEMTIGGRIGAAADEGEERCRVIATVESSRGAPPRFIWVAAHWSGTRARVFN
jgi:hypothetical protein